MSDEMRVQLTIAALVLYGAFALAALRAARHARRVAAQWDNRSGDNWQWGKVSLVAGLVGMVFVFQRLFPLPPLGMAAGFLLCLALLVYGEWRIGTGFRDLADAQDHWHRRNFGDDE